MTLSKGGTEWDYLIFSSDIQSSDIDIESTIRDRVEESFQELPIDGLVVEVNGSSVNIAGLAKNYETRDRASRR